MSAAIEPQPQRLMPVADAVLVDRVRQRDIEALAELEHRYRDSLYALVYGITMDSTQADRVVHDLFVHLWRAWDRNTLQHSAWNWLRLRGAELAHAEHAVRRLK
jgi:DNA-directed RNA polymerase specialized sigma24 family protein